jgi:pimeloyl-ACP methyl ester carboxylesterase
MKNIILLYSLLLSISLFYIGCRKDIVYPGPAVVEQKKEHYVSGELLASVPQNTLQMLVASQGFDAYRNEIKYGVSVYRVVYHTTYQGKEIKASGLICVPLNRTTPAPVLSAQHGTIFSNEEAPSNFTGLTGFELLAAGGYVTLIPDYIGFGESKGYFHPYYDQKHSAAAVVDFIKAGKAFYKEYNIAVNDQLFLAGYSEGGYVTLAAQNEIETNPAHGLKLTAVAAGAGGYDIASLLDAVTEKKSHPYPAYLAYVVQAYNRTNGWDRPLTDFFQEPYASRLPGLFNFINDGGTVNQQLTTQVRNLFSPDFLYALENEGQENAFYEALQENSFQNWAPQSPTRLYHGTADEIVPFANSERTFKRFKAQGADQIELIPLKGGTHGSAIKPMLQSLIPWLQSFSK